MGPPRNIIVFHAGALGDLINTVPALNALSQQYPSAPITAVGNPAWLSLLQAAGIIASAVPLDRPGFHHLFSESPLPPGLHSWLQSFGLALSYIRSPQLIAHLRAIPLPTLSLDAPFPPPPGSPHITDYMLEPLNQLGLDARPPSTPILKVRAPSAPISSSSLVRAPLGAIFSSPRLALPPSPNSAPRFPGILIHPGSGSPSKNFPPALFAQAATLLAAHTQLPLAIIAGPADAQPANELQTLLPHAALFKAEGASDVSRDISSPLPLAALLSSARILLANDSGVAHLAGALSLPVISLFKSSDPAIWSVRQPHAVNLTSPTPDLILSHALRLLD